MIDFDELPIPAMHSTYDIIDPLWREMRAYAGRLVADLADTDMVSQPLDGVTMNHPAWILSHLSVYAPVLECVLRSHDAQDPIDHRFGPKSSPQTHRDAYPSDLLELYITGYDRAMAALADVPPARLDEPVPIERWRARFPTIGLLPVQFVIKHNAQHLGQLSAWRRAMGLPRV